MQHKNALYHEDDDSSPSEITTGEVISLAIGMPAIIIFVGVFLVAPLMLAVSIRDFCHKI